MLNLSPWMPNLVLDFRFHLHSLCRLLPLSEFSRHDCWLACSVRDDRYLSCGILESAGVDVSAVLSIQGRLSCARLPGDAAYKDVPGDVKYHICR